MNTVVTLIIIFGGILFFILDTMLFEMKESNIKWILMCISAFIPLVGLGIYGILFFYCMGNYEIDGTKYTHKDHYNRIYVKDTKLNRWLFNDVEWSFIDSIKNITKNEKDN
jgi:hypothetical protein